MAQPGHTGDVTAVGLSMGLNIMSKLSEMLSDLSAIVN